LKCPPPCSALSILSHAARFPVPPPPQLDPRTQLPLGPPGSGSPELLGPPLLFSSQEYRGVFGNPPRRCSRLLALASRRRDAGHRVPTMDAFHFVIEFFFRLPAAPRRIASASCCFSIRQLTVRLCQFETESTGSSAAAAAVLDRAGTLRLGALVSKQCRGQAQGLAVDWTLFLDDQSSALLRFLPGVVPAIGAFDHGGSKSGPSGLARGADSSCSTRWSQRSHRCAARWSVFDAA